MNAGTLLKGPAVCRSDPSPRTYVTSLQNQVQQDRTLVWWLTMAVNLTIWHQLKPKRWALLWGAFLTRSLEVGSPTPLSEPHLLVAVCTKGQGRKKLLLFACLSSLLLSSSSTLLMRHSFTVDKIYFFQILTQTEESRSPQALWHCSTRSRLLKTSSLTDCIATTFCAFPSGLLGPQPVRHAHIFHPINSVPLENPD